MKKLCAAILALLVVGNSAALLFACGDKFLVPNRGSRSQRPGAPRDPAAILIYDSGSDLQKGLKGVSVNDTLRKAGFRPTTAVTADDFERQLRTGRWDAVLVGIAEAPSVSNRLRGNAQAPVIIPVAFEVRDAQLKEQRKQYSVVLRVPAKNAAFLAAIDKALESKPKPSKSL